MNTYKEILAILIGFSILAFTIVYCSNAESAQKIENLKEIDKYTKEN